MAGEDVGFDLPYVPDVVLEYDFEIAEERGPLDLLDRCREVGVGWGDVIDVYMEERQGVGIENECSLTAMTGEYGAPVARPKRCLQHDRSIVDVHRMRVAVDLISRGEHPGREHTAHQPGTFRIALYLKHLRPLGGLPDQVAREEVDPILPARRPGHHPDVLAVRGKYHRRDLQ